MKAIVKTAISIAILFVISLPITAQENNVKAIKRPAKDSYKNKFFAGFSFGMSAAWWAGAREDYINDVEEQLELESLYVDFKSLPRYSISCAIQLEYCFNKHLRLYTEAAYVNKGQVYSGDGYMLYQEYYGSQTERLDFFMRMKMRVNYVQIPLMFKVVTTPGIYFEAGPHLDITTHGKIHMMVKADDEKESNAEKMPMLRPINYGISGGMGFQKNGFGIDLRFIADFADTFKDGANPYELKNRMVQLTFGIYPGQMD